MELIVFAIVVSEIDFLFFIDMGKFVSGNLEVVVGGGVSLDNTAMILGSLQPPLRQAMTDFSLHTYSAMLEDGPVSAEKVHRLKFLVAHEYRPDSVPVY